MRTYGRVNNGGVLTWVEVQTDATGDNSLVHLTAMAQVIQLVLGESPFFANWGIPAIRSVVQQIFPDFYMTQIQQQFAGFFASLIITRLPGRTPSYSVAVTTNQGTKLNATVKVPT